MLYQKLTTSMKVRVKVITILWIGRSENSYHGNGALVQNYDGRLKDFRDIVR